MQLTQQPTYVQRDLDNGDGRKFNAFTIRLHNQDGKRVAEIVAYSGDIDRSNGSLEGREAAEDAAAYIMRAVEVLNLMRKVIAAHESEQQEAAK